MQERARVLCPEAERADRMLLRLGAMSVLVERPRENVLTLDTRAKPLADTRLAESCCDLAVVVETEERDLELVAAAVGDEGAFEHLSLLICLFGLPPPSHLRVDVTERHGVVRHGGPLQCEPEELCGRR